MGTIRAQPARLPIPLTLTPSPQQLVLPLWRWEGPAEAPPLLPNDEAICIPLHQVWTQLSPTQQRQLRRALLQVLQEVLYDPARQS